MYLPTGHSPWSQHRLPDRCPRLPVRFPGSYLGGNLRQAGRSRRTGLAPGQTRYRPWANAPVLRNQISQEPPELPGLSRLTQSFTSAWYLLGAKRFSKYSTDVPLCRRCSKAPSETPVNQERALIRTSSPDLLSLTCRADRFQWDQMHCATTVSRVAECARNTGASEKTPALRVHATSTIQMNNDAIQLTPFKYPPENGNCTARSSEPARLPLQSCRSHYGMNARDGLHLHPKSAAYWEPRTPGGSGLCKYERAIATTSRRSLP